MAKKLLIAAGCLELIAGIVFLLIVKFSFMGILFLIAGMLFISAALLTKNE